MAETAPPCGLVLVSNRPDGSSRVIRTTGVTDEPPLAWATPCQAMAADSRSAPAGTVKVAWCSTQGAPFVGYTNGWSVVELSCTVCWLSPNGTKVRVVALTVVGLRPVLTTVTLSLWREPGWPVMSS